MMIRSADVAGRRVDVRIEGGRIREIRESLPSKHAEDEFDARGGALLPGLHDHHIHVFSLAASLQSIECGPPKTNDAKELQFEIERASRATGTDSGWLRGTGYFESVAGPLDRHILDRLCPNRPIRIQHRSGSMWFLNSLAIQALGLDDHDPDHTESSLPAGLERDDRGRTTGRLFRLDQWLRSRIPQRGQLDLSVAGRKLASYGVTGVTDATPSNGPEEVEIFRRARASGALPQRLMLMGSSELSAVHEDSGISIGPFKVLLDEPSLPNLETLIDSVRASHSSGRPVAIHTVTRSEIHFALAALEAAGAVKGDRLEHASIAPAEAIEIVRELGITIVTQPNFVAERGDDYLTHVEPVDRPFLYRLQAWRDAAVPLGGGTDAPFGDSDPWIAMRAAVERSTRSGLRLGAEEALSPECALGLFLTEPTDPGGPSRTIKVGARADLCVLDVPWQKARNDLSADHVVATLCDGRFIWKRPDLGISVESSTPSL